ncbi:hypothetical protein [Herbidospora daliensis]|uniref:hypothetical protein n=1 Tax=Herbidospora daliensis TaxID=295585 RepID=UPI00078396B9|nr:hypothetical protein [Herbidospora daliensis]
MNWLRDNDPAADVHPDPAAMAATLDEIVGTRRPVRRRRRRWLVLVPLTAVLATVAVVLQPGGAPFVLGPAKAVAFARQGDRIDVRIADPDADPRRYREDFAAHGLKVDLVLKPTSPSLVGMVVSVSSPQTATGHDSDGFEISGGDATYRVESIGGGDCGDFHCAAGIGIPLDLPVPLDVIVGRPARPGERYEIWGDPTAPGEVLAGDDLVNLTVDQARDVVRQRGGTVESHLQPPDGSGRNWVYDDHALAPEQVPGSWYVHDVFGGHYAGQVRLVVAAQPTDRPFWNFVDSLMFWR